MYLLPTTPDVMNNIIDEAKPGRKLPQNISSKINCSRTNACVFV